MGGGNPSQPAMTETKKNPTLPASGIHWPGWGEDYHPLWPRETLEKWVEEGRATKEQLKRYRADIEWYRTHEGDTVHHD